MVSEWAPRAERQFVKMIDHQHVAPVLVRRTPVACNAKAVHRRVLNGIWPNGIGHVMGPRVSEMPRQAVAIALVKVHLEGVVFGSKGVCPIVNVRDRRINREKRPPGSRRACTWSGHIGIYRIHHAIGPRSNISYR